MVAPTPVVAEEASQGPPDAKVEKAPPNDRWKQQEKNLKKTFIIATLVSTIIGTFGSAQGLYDRLKQRKVDKKQNAEIQALREEIDKKNKYVEEVEKGGSTKASNPRSRPASPDSGDVERSLQRSSKIISNTQKFYDDDLRRMDRRLQQRFAMGDCKLPHFC